MYSTELIRKFPDDPQEPILYVVYNDNMKADAEAFITILRGKDYFTQHVTIKAFDEPYDRDINYQIYIDPMVYVYKNSWN